MESAVPFILDFLTGDFRTASQALWKPLLPSSLLMSHWDHKSHGQVPSQYVKEIPRDVDTGRCDSLGGHYRNTETLLLSVGSNEVFIVLSVAFVRQLSIHKAIKKGLL